jgi:GDP-D-mannose dehydratase
MWLMLQQDKPEDFVLATGETHPVREYVEKAFKVVGVDIVWEGKEENEVGKDKATGKVRVRIDPRYYRPTEVELLLGDPTKAKTKLGWEVSTSPFFSVALALFRAWVFPGEQASKEVFLFFCFLQHKVSFDQLVKEMVEADIAQIKSGKDDNN